MKLNRHQPHRSHIYFIAFLLPLLLLLLFPQQTSAHAILVRSDPAQDSTLSASPPQIHMWFSENLNPTFTTAYVVNAANSVARVESDPKTHVDQGDAHVSHVDAKEMDLSLEPNLPSAVYIVLYRTQSADDGHILNGSFLFTIKASNGAVPTYNGSLPGQNIESSASGQLDAPTIWSLIMTTLVDLGAVFWAGAQLWHIFVFPFIETPDQEQRAIFQRTEQRFTARFAIPVLVFFLLANIGVLIGQALSITNGLQAFNPALLAGLVTQGQFGTYWIAREIIASVALLLSIASVLLIKRNARWFTELEPWLQFGLALFLLAAITLSGHAAATSHDIVVYAVLSDLLHLIAASLWIGGMIYISVIYLPVLQSYPMLTRARSLLTVLPRYSPLAFVGVGIMALSGPFNATTRMSSFNQLLSTLYGRALIVKVLLVGALLVTSAIHVFIMRPRLARNFKQYDDLAKTELTTVTAQDDTSAQAEKSVTESQQKTLEMAIGIKTQALSKVLHWEPALGVLVLICTGLLTVFSGTLQPAAQPTPIGQTAATVTQPTPAPTKPFITTVKTSDQKFQVKLSVDPNHFGTNTFTATVLDKNGKVVPSSQVGVSLYTTMLDMDMGTDSVNLQPDGKGNFSAQGDLGMGGNWQIRIEIRTTDDTLHNALIRIYTPF